MNILKQTYVLCLYLQKAPHLLLCKQHKEFQGNAYLFIYIFYLVSEKTLGKQMGFFLNIFSVITCKKSLQVSHF